MAAIAAAGATAYRRRIEEKIQGRREGRQDRGKDEKT